MADLFGKFDLDIRVTDIHVENPSSEAIPNESLPDRSITLTRRLMENLLLWKIPHPEILESHQKRGTTALTVNLRKLIKASRPLLEELTCGMLPSTIKASRLWILWNPPPGHQILQISTKYLNTSLICDYLAESTTALESTFKFHTFILSTFLSIFLRYFSPENNNYFNYYFFKNNNNSMENFLKAFNICLINYAETKQWEPGGSVLFSIKPLVKIKLLRIEARTSYEHQTPTVLACKQYTNKLEWYPQLIERAVLNMAQIAGNTDAPIYIKDLRQAINLLETKYEPNQSYERFVLLDKVLMDLKLIDVEHNSWPQSLQITTKKKKKKTEALTRKILEPSENNVPPINARDYTTKDPERIEMINGSSKEKPKNRRKITNDINLKKKKNKNLCLKYNIALKTVAIKVGATNLERSKDIWHRLFTFGCL